MFFKKSSLKLLEDFCTPSEELAQHAALLLVGGALHFRADTFTVVPVGGGARRVGGGQRGRRHVGVDRFGSHGRPIVVMLWWGLKKVPVLLQ